MNEDTKKQLKTIDIKGNPYVEVSERVREFRENPRYNGYSLETKIFELTNSEKSSRVVFIASVFDQYGQLKATGTAYEKEGGTFINKTSFIENCETSAVGRALGFLGIGITSFIRSADEHKNASANQEPLSEEQRVKINQLIHKAIIKESVRSQIFAEMDSFDPEKAQDCIWFLEANQKMSNIESAGGGYGQKDIMKKLDEKQKDQKA